MKKYNTCPYDFSTHGGIFYLRVKSREEGTPRHGIRRHVDFIDDHCHASCQMIFLPAIRQFEVWEIFFCPVVCPILCSTTCDTSHVEHVLLVSIKCIYLHAPLRSTDIFKLFELHSVGEIISRSALGKFKALGRRNSHVKSSKQLSESVMTQDHLR